MTNTKIFRLLMLLFVGGFILSSASDALAQAQNKYKEKNVNHYIAEYGIKKSGLSISDEAKAAQEKADQAAEEYKNKRTEILKECQHTYASGVQKRENLADQAWEDGKTGEYLYQKTRSLWNRTGINLQVDKFVNYLKTDGIEWMVGLFTDFNFEAQIDDVKAICEEFEVTDIDSKLDELRDLAQKATQLQVQATNIAGTAKGMGDDVYVHMAKDSRGNPVEIRFIVNTKDNTIKSVSGNTQGCEPLPFKVYEAKSCLFCPLFTIIYKAIQTASTEAYRTLSRPLSTLLLIGLAIWIALMVLRNVSAMTKQDAPQFLTDLFKNSFRVVIAFLLLRYSSIVYGVVIGPLLKAGFEFGGSFLNSTQDVVKNCSMKPVSGEIGVLPEYVYVNLQCFLEAVQFELGVTQAIGSSLMCVAKHQGATSIGYLANVLPDFSMLFTGALVWIIAFVISIAFGFYLIDAVIQLGIFGMLLPFLLMCYPFKITSGYFNTGVGVFMNSWFIFVFMGLVTNITLALIGQGATAGKGDMYDIETAINGNDIDALKNFVDIGFAGFVILLACCVFAVKLMGKVTELAGKFSGGGLNLGIGNKVGGLAASGVVNTAKWGVDKAKGTLSAVGNAVGNARVFGEDGKEWSVMDKVRGARHSAARAVGKGIGGTAYVAGKVMTAPVRFAKSLFSGKGRRS